MQPSPALADLLHAWHDFYALVGAASATLIGLLFVAASIGSSYFSEKHRGPLNSFLTPTVAHFGAALFACILGCVPIQNWRSFGALLGLGGALGLIYCATIAFRLIIRRRFKVELSDQVFYAGVPTLGYLTMLIAAVLLLMENPAGAVAIAVALLILLFAGIRNAWDMTLWTATTSTAPNPPP
jgi:hypothetical protein